MKLRLVSIVATLVLALNAFAPTLAQAVATGPCRSNGQSAFRLIPTWYQYLDEELDDNCRIVEFAWGSVWKIALAIIEILLRVAGLVAVAFVVWGGFKYVLSRGNSGEAAKARQTIIDALIGIAIATVASALVAFLGRALTS
jgi:hypothetical protein